MLIKVAEQCGQLCIAAEDGEALNGQLCAALAAGQHVVLDFTSARVFSAPFFNAMVGTLLSDFTPQQLDERLRFEGLHPDADEILRRVIKNSREYFSNPKVREKLREILGSL